MTPLIVVAEGSFGSLSIYKFDKYRSVENYDQFALVHLYNHPEFKVDSWWVCVDKTTGRVVFDNPNYKQLVKDLPEFVERYEKVFGINGEQRKKYERLVEQYNQVKKRYKQAK